MYEFYLVFEKTNFIFRRRKRMALKFIVNKSLITLLSQPSSSLVPITLTDSMVLVNWRPSWMASTTFLPSELAKPPSNSKMVPRSSLLIPKCNLGKILWKPLTSSRRIDGILMGDRRLNFINAVVFLDKKQKVSAEVNFLYEAHGTIHRMANGFKKLFGHGKEKLPSDAFEIVIFNYDKDKDGEAKKKVLLEGS